MVPLENFRVNFSFISYSLHYSSLIEKWCVGVARKQKSASWREREMVEETGVCKCTRRYLQCARAYSYFWMVFLCAIFFYVCCLQLCTLSLSSPFQSPSFTLNPIPTALGICWLPTVVNLKHVTRRSNRKGNQHSFFILPPSPFSLLYPSLHQHVHTTLTIPSASKYQLSVHWD